MEMPITMQGMVKVDMKDIVMATTDMDMITVGNTTMMVTIINDHKKTNKLIQLNGIIANDESVYL